jgi:SAM-dependent methyltransferase
MACGAAAERFLYAVNGCGIWQCRSCGIGRTEQAAFDPTSYYTGDYFSGQHADGYADYLGAEAVLRGEFARTVDFLRKFCSSGRLLELGCAYGFFLREAERYFDVVGIELAEHAAEHARKSGLNVLSGVADDANMQRIGKVDAIVVLDVIEHLPDPHAVLQTATKSLNPGGVVMITTGDFGSLSAKLSGKGWRLMTPPQHLWFFTQESMRRLAAALGLSVEHADHPWKTVPASLILFQLQRMLGLPAKRATLANHFGIPVNLFDAMRVVLRKPSA